MDEVSIADWDKSYTVNLHGLVMLAQKFLPDMLQGFEKNAARLEENSRIMRGWIDELSRVMALL